MRDGREERHKAKDERFMTLVIGRADRVSFVLYFYLETDSFINR